MSIDDSVLRDYVRRMAGFTLSTAWLDYGHLTDGALGLLKELRDRITISDIPGIDNEVEKALESRALDAESQADEFAAELDRLRVNLKAAEADAVEWAAVAQRHRDAETTAIRERDEARAALYREQDARGVYERKADAGDRRIVELRAKLERIARGNRHPGGEMMTATEMMRIARAVLLDAPAQPATATKPVLDAEGERIVAGLAKRWREFKADRRACPECGTTNRVHDEKCSLRDPAEAAPPSPAAKVSGDDK